MRLITLVVVCILGPAAAVTDAPPASPESRFHTSACRFFTDLIRESLLSELEAECDTTSAPTCEDKNTLVRSILTYIDAQRLHNEDECNTAITALDRLRALPPQDR